MGAWLLVPFSTFVTFTLKFIIFPYKPSHKLNAPLPPGPTTLPIIGNFIWLFKLASRGMDSILRDLHAKYGSVVSVPVPFTHPVIMIADRSLAHQALVKNSAVFADRPEARPSIKFMTSNQQVAATAGYGPTWRLIRRNLISEVMIPSKLKAYAGTRKWALDDLVNRLGTASSSGRNMVQVLDHLRMSVTGLFLYMCFGEKMEEEKVRETVDVQGRFLAGLVGEFKILNFGAAWFTKILFYKRWGRFFQILQQQMDLLLPLIQTRKKIKEEGKWSSNRKENDNNSNNIAFVDTLLGLELPEEKRTFDNAELVNQCSDFVIAGFDTIVITLQWMMANVVKHPHIQEKIVLEIKEVVGEVEEVKEDDLHKMKFLKAVVLEGLRRHPPGHFLLPHSVTEDVILDGRYAIPKDCTVNFSLAEMGRDPKVWAEPMEFKPERFLSGEENVCDITGSKDIKMMPFGVGRRMCPASSLSMVLLEYFVANLVWKFEWRAVEGVGVDMSEKVETSWGMKNPLQAHITPRLNY
ncbi:cytochrome P450 89A2-like [Argentina anserina]|uniref:cytochrome P450 89A2-like n=1 Tax=Argentina anserina TaxID=57926 RepID=UPI0021762239|nr:cytochrome P450 89A2-like [Potentilla anserina]